MRAKSLFLLVNIFIGVGLIYWGIKRQNYFNTIIDKTLKSYEEPIQRIALWTNFSSYPDISYNLIFLGVLIISSTILFYVLKK